MRAGAVLRDEHLLSADDAETLDGIYRAVHFVVDHCPRGEQVVAALATTICDYLRMAPAEMRGPVADRIITLIREDVRQSLL